MRLIRFGQNGHEKPGVLLRDGTRLDVSAATKDYDETFFSADAIESLRKWLDKNESRRIG